MHLAEGLLPPVQAAGWFVASSPFVVASYRKVEKLTNSAGVRERALFGLGCALSFAVTLFPIPVPGLGATSHMCATPIMAMLFGPLTMVLPITLVLLVQALFLRMAGFQP